MVNYFEKCQHCVPPERHPGCHGSCQFYAEARARFEADKAKENKSREIRYYCIEKHGATLDGIAKYARKRPKNHRPK